MKNKIYANASIVTGLSVAERCLGFLYSVVLSEVDKYIRKDDNIHLSEEGIAICSKQVADIIRAVAESLEDDVSEKVNIYRENDDSNGAPV